MIAEIIAVGTELLLGNILNSNAKYLSEECAELGLSVYYQTVVGDNEERLTKVANQAIGRSDVIILTGGLGPTKDDLTKEVVAKLMNKKLVLHEPSKERIIEYFNKRKLDMTENNLKQALIPEGAVPLLNNNGTAPGILLHYKEIDKVIILLPGPPKEMQPMFSEHVKPYLKKQSNYVIVSKVLKVVGIGESKVETLISDIIENQYNPTIAPYAKDGEVHLRITAKAKSEQEANKLIEPVEFKIKKILGIAVYADDEKTTLEESVVEILKQNNLTLSIAESCTGGLLSATVVNCSGASSVFTEGIVTYSNEAKNKYLDVNEDIINKYGAVSEQTAYAMAKGMAKKANTDISLSVTGIAGPTGGTEQKPVGLVYIGCYIKGNIIVKETNIMGFKRKKIKK